MPVRDSEAAARAARGSTVAARHVGGRSRLVEEDQPVGTRASWFSNHASRAGPYVFARLLGRVDRPFLRVMPCRAKKRDRLLVLVCRPRYSCRKMAGRAS